jgi:hypothetical protein
LGRSAKTRDFLVEALAAWWAAWEEGEQVALARLQINMDHGPESRGKRTQFLQRLVAFCDAIGQPMQRLYSPPYQSQYHPIERCWGLLELPWNGTTVVDVETRVEWANSRTCKGLHPIVELRRQVYQKGVTLRKRAMRAVENRWERHPELPTYDIGINPAPTS